MRAFFADTHNLAEGAGAAGLAALLQQREKMKGRKVGVVLSGGNVDSEVFARVLQGARPSLDGKSHGREEPKWKVRHRLEVVAAGTDSANSRHRRTSASDAGTISWESLGRL